MYEKVNWDAYVKIMFAWPHAAKSVVVAGRAAAVAMLARPRERREIS